MTPLIRRIYLSTVFLTGLAVLVVEVAAVRVFAPYFGSSLYVLSGVLTVILMALSCGYYYGGRLADRHPTPVVLYTIITLAGLLLLICTYAANFILPIIGPYTPLAIGPLLYSLLFFFIPAFLLGIDSPFVIKLASQSTDESERGAIVGSTFFWSTIGSITGSLLAGFYLIPSFGLTTTLYGTSISLLILGVGAGYLVATYHTPPLLIHWYRLWPLALIIGIVCGALIIVSLHQEPKQVFLYERDGLYSNIKIFDQDYHGQTARFLKRDTNSSSAIYPGSDELVFTYTQFAPLFTSLKADATSFLLVGGGAYTIPRTLHKLYPDLAITVAEVEPSLFGLAQTYFELPMTDNITNQVIDGRMLLARSTTTYDVIYLDAFSTGHFIPPHLVTTEFFALVRERLSPDGVLFINFIGNRRTTEAASVTGSFFKTLMTSFPSISVYSNATDYPRLLQNLIVVARPHPDLPSTLPPDIEINNQGIVTTVDALQVPYAPLIQAADVIFTDDRSTLERMLVAERSWSM